MTTNLGGTIIYWFTSLKQLVADFEVDTRRYKNRANKDKHSIDFDVAQALWDDSEWVEVSVKQLDKPRYLVIGKVDSRHWSVVITYRGENIKYPSDFCQALTKRGDREL